MVEFGQVFDRPRAAYPDGVDLRFGTGGKLHEGSARLASLILYKAVEQGAMMGSRHGLRISGRFWSPRELPATDFDLQLDGQKVALEWGGVQIRGVTGKGGITEVRYKGQKLSPLGDETGMALVPKGYPESPRSFPRDTLTNPVVAADVIFGHAEQTIVRCAARRALNQTMQV